MATRENLLIDHLLEHRRLCSPMQIASGERNSSAKRNGCSQLRVPSGTKEAADWSASLAEARLAPDYFASNGQDLGRGQPFRPLVVLRGGWRGLLCPNKKSCGAVWNRTYDCSE